MNALVTGATGFVGGHVVDALLARGDRVTALVRSPARAAALATAGVTLVEGDLENRSALQEAVRQQDVIYHIAGAVAAPNEAAYLKANRDGTASLLRAAEAAGSPRFVLMSSGAAGGPSHRGVPRTEVQPDAPVTAYGRSKRAAEEVVRHATVPWVILRPPTVYGPRDRDNLIKVFRIARTGVVPVFGDGLQELSMVYASDLADATVLAGTAPGVTGAAYYVNHPEIVTSAGLVRRIGSAMHRRVRVIGLPRWVAMPILGVTQAAARLAGRTTILNVEKANEFYGPAWTADPSAFMEASGWLPSHDLTEGLAATWQWYRQARWL